MPRPAPPLRASPGLSAGSPPASGPVLQLNAGTRIRDLQQGPPGLLRVLESAGLYRDGDDPGTRIGELCWRFGFNPGILLMMLESANVAAEPAPPDINLDIQPFRAMPLGQLVDHIENVHHGFLRRELPRIMGLVDAAAPESGPGLDGLRDELGRLAAELEAHLAHEEEALFPMVRQLGSGSAVSPTRCGGSVGGPIACMENEHEQAVRSLWKLRELTRDYAPGPGGTAAMRELMDALANLDRDLREHMYKEDQALFPRALQAQREGAAAGH